MRWRLAFAILALCAPPLFAEGSEGEYDCDLPSEANETDKYDFSECKTRIAKHERSCKVSCASGAYGSNATTFKCPSAGGVWKGNVPTCTKCATTKRPSDEHPELNDDCDKVVKGDTCNATCASVAGDENATRETFTCEKDAPGSFPWSRRHCTCFTSDSEKGLDCDRCVAPDLGPKASDFDASDCSSGDKHKSCTVECAALHGHGTSTFTCVGPPYRTYGDLPTCSSGCATKRRPQDEWHDKGVVDNCGDDLKQNQACVASCAPGYVVAEQEELFICVEADADSGVCNCYSGTQPQCIDKRQCTQLPAIPNATLKTKGPVPHGDKAEYQCDNGFTKDGKSGGSTTIVLECQDGYLSNFLEAGCAPVSRSDPWPACSLNSSLSESKQWDLSRCGSDASVVKRDGESCAVTCASGYLEPTERRFEEAVNSTKRAPTILQCYNGTFYGELPVCHEVNPVLELDVYAVLKTGDDNQLLYPWGAPVLVDGSSVLSNINVFDLEGLLLHIYTELLYFQQELAEVPDLARDSETGKWVGPVPPYLPITRDEVDVVVWYRMQMQNPTLSAPDVSYAQFGNFADFQHGGAANQDAGAAFGQDGGAVGAQQQAPGFTKVYKAKPGSSATDEECADPTWIGQKDWKQECEVEENPRYDPRYQPADRFVRFSLPGACPNLPFNWKFADGGFNASCVASPKGGGKFLGGNCSKTPTGDPDCTYTLKELARVPLGDLTGMSSESCSGGSCSSLRKFQVGCQNPDLRRGVKIAQGGNVTDMRECTEYAINGKMASGGGSMECGNATVERAKVWSCMDACNNSEATTGSLAGRCSADKNGDRLKRFQSLFAEALQRRVEGEANDEEARKLQSPPAPLLQDCSRFDDSICSEPDPELGLGYCARDKSGVCNPCYVPNTSAFDPGRTLNLDPCPGDLFSSGAYRVEDSLPDCAGETPTTACCMYLWSCTREWEPQGDWSACGTTCGQRLQTKKVTCKDESTLGDCRRSIGLGGGDPGGAGWCDETGCFEARTCNGTQCPWLPFCSDSANGGGQMGSSEADADEAACLPAAWGPIDSGCAWGYEERYSRCTFFDTNFTDFGASFCSSSKQPSPTRRERFSGHPSRLPNCGQCAVDSGHCNECVAGEVLHVDSDGKCTNDEPFLQLQFSLTLPFEFKESLRSLGFHGLQSLVANATAKAGTWSADDIFLVEAIEDYGVDSTSLRSKAGRFEVQLDIKEVAMTRPSLRAAAVGDTQVIVGRRRLADDGGKDPTTTTPSTASATTTTTPTTTSPTTTAPTTTSPTTTTTTMTTSGKTTTTTTTSHTTKKTTTTTTSHTTKKTTTTTTSHTTKKTTTTTTSGNTTTTTTTTTTSDNTTTTTSGNTTTTTTTTTSDNTTTTTSGNSTTTTTTSDNTTTTTSDNTTTTTSGNSTTTTTADNTTTTSSGNSTTAPTTTVATTTQTPPPPPPTSAKEAWKITIMLRGPGVGKSSTAPAPIQKAQNAIEDGVKEALAQVLQAQPSSLEVGMGELALFCPGMDKASRPSDKCGNYLVWMLVGGSVVLLFGAGVGVGLCWWRQLGCFRRPIYMEERLWSG